MRHCGDTADLPGFHQAKVNSWLTVGVEMQLKIGNAWRRPQAATHARSNARAPRRIPRPKSP
jgi:hypothetical protein